MLRPYAKPGRRILALIAGLEEGVQPLAPFLNLLASVPEPARLYDVVGVLSNDGWRSAQFYSTGGGQFVPWSGPLPAASEIVAAIAFPGLLRDLDVLGGLPSAGVPTLLVPSATPCPLQELAPEGMILRHLTPSGLAGILQRLGKGSHKDMRALRGEQLAWTQQFLLSRVLAEWVDQGSDSLDGAAGSPP